MIFKVNILINILSKAQFFNHKMAHKKFSVFPVTSYNYISDFPCGSRSIHVNSYLVVPQTCIIFVSVGISIKGFTFADVFKT